MKCEPKNAVKSDKKSITLHFDSDRYTGNQNSASDCAATTVKDATSTLEPTLVF
jgi:hypothetical protein